MYKNKRICYKIKAETTLQWNYNLNWFFYTFNIYPKGKRKGYYWLKEQVILLKYPYYTNIYQFNKICNQNFNVHSTPNIITHCIAFNMSKKLCQQIANTKIPGYCTLAGALSLEIWRVSSIDSISQWESTSFHMLSSHIWPAATLLEKGEGQSNRSRFHLLLRVSLCVSFCVCLLAIYTLSSI